MRRFGAQNEIIFIMENRKVLKHFTICPIMHNVCLERCLFDTIVYSLTLKEKNQPHHIRLNTMNMCWQATAMTEYISTVLPGYLTNIDKFLGANNDGKGFLVGSKVSVCSVETIDTCKITIVLLTACTGSDRHTKRVTQFH